MKSLTQVMSGYKTSDAVMVDAVLANMKRGRSLKRSVMLARAQRSETVGVKEATHAVVEARSKIARYLLPKLKAKEIQKVEEMIEEYKETLFDFKEAQFSRIGLSKTGQAGKEKIEKEYSS